MRTVSVWMYVSCLQNLSVCFPSCVCVSCYLSVGGWSGSCVSACLVLAIGVVVGPKACLAYILKAQKDPGGKAVTMLGLQAHQQQVSPA